MSQFETWFEAWLAVSRRLGRLRRLRRLRQEYSQDVYRDILGGFVEWCLSQEPVVRLLDFSVADLNLFVSTRRGLSDRDGELTARYTWRMLNLIDRVLRYAACTTARTGTPRPWN